MKKLTKAIALLLALTLLLTFPVVKDDTPGNATVILEGMDDGIQEALQILPLVGNDIRRTAMTKPGTEQTEDDLLTIHVNSGLTPVDLDGLSRCKAQRDKYFRLLAGCTHIVNQIPDRRLTAGKVLFFYQTL